MLLWYLWVVCIYFTKKSFGVVIEPEIRLINESTIPLSIEGPVQSQNSNDTASFEVLAHKPSLVFPIRKNNSYAIPNSQKEDQELKEKHKVKEDSIKKNDGKKETGKKTLIVNNTGKGNNNTDEVTDNGNNPKIPAKYFPTKLAQSLPELIHEDIAPTTSVDVLNTEKSPLLRIVSTLNKTSTSELSVVNKTKELSTKNYLPQKEKLKTKNFASESDDMNSGKHYNGEYEDLGEADKIKFKADLSNSTQSKDVGKENTTKEIPRDPGAETLSGFNTSGSYLASNEKGKAKLQNSNDNYINVKSSEKFASTTTKDIKKDDLSFKFTRSGVTIFIISLTVIAAFVYSGFIVRKKLMLRQYRREILINEEEFCEDCTDTHQFEMDQQRNMNVII
ncbi:uncharacterized protein LOC142321873 isoform X1 [Lycorma delicatula]|uniref:uncharacterized protein LOC142321873 isoform X1 n=1 Tax=Lycorma delicatula TaxID=130591 RepID=UPI003F510D5E